MENFTPVAGLIGGMLIGLSATLLLLFNGRIAGVSGILSGAFLEKGDRSWRWMFLVGMILTSFVYQLFYPESFTEPENIPLLILISGSFIIGFGTRMGGGCTSGHGICGIGRISPRSIAATFIFMGSGLVTVYIMKHVLGITS